VKLTNPFLTRSRREAIALAAREQINAATARMQRNVYREHADRMAGAIAEINAAWSTPPSAPSTAPWSPQETAAMTRAIGTALGIAQMAADYDTLQATTDPTIQEN
jgi:hypothetical protein